MHICFLCTSLRSCFQFVLHTLCCNLGMLTCMLRSVRICRGVGVGVISSFLIVLVVRQAIFRSIFLNGLIMNVVSLPVYVNDVCGGISFFD